MQWDDPLRLAIHEVGHVVVEYVLTGNARACYIIANEDGSYTAQTEPVSKAASGYGSSAQDYLHLAAAYLGGWAAVQLAILDHILPTAPTTVETVPGDHGFIGSDQIYMHWAAVQANMMDPGAIVAEAKKLALDTLQPWMAKVVELAEFGKGAGYVGDDMVKATITI